MRLDGDHCFEFEHDGITHPVYRDGSGPGVLVMHEMPGMTPKCLELADRLIGNASRRICRGFSESGG